MVFPQGIVDYPMTIATTTTVTIDRPVIDLQVTDDNSRIQQITRVRYTEWIRVYVMWATDALVSFSSALGPILISKITLFFFFLHTHSLIGQNKTKQQRAPRIRF